MSSNVKPDHRYRGSPNPSEMGCCFYCGGMGHREGCDEFLRRVVELRSWLAAGAIRADDPSLGKPGQVTRVTVE